MEEGGVGWGPIFMFYAGNIVELTGAPPAVRLRLLCTGRGDGGRWAFCIAL